MDFAGVGLRLLVVDTRAHHALIDGGYAERRASCETVAQKLEVRSMRDLDFNILNEAKSVLTNVEFQRAKHAVTEIARVLAAVSALEARNFKELGELLTQSHQSLRDDYDVSCSEIGRAHV